MTDEVTPEQTAPETPAQPEPRQVDAVVAVAETMAILFSSLLELIPPMPVQEGDVLAIGRIQRAQGMLNMGMQQLHTLLHMMGSPMVAAPPEEATPVPAPAPSGIILPGR